MHLIKIFLPISIILISLTVFFTSSPQTISELNPSEINLSTPTVLATESKFTYETIDQGTKIPFKTIIESSLDKDACSDDEIIQPGIIGNKTKEIQITYYEGEEYHREIIATHTTPPQDQIILKGTQKNYQSIQTDSGTITYWCKLGTFTATAYDATCNGCSQSTAIGLKTGFGVVAVDKNVISLGSQLYITGYGKAIAGDTGGYIKGNRIDLGFDSIGKWWGKRQVEVYLL
jgi:3D (Asp-Asp-Asp) domain-containing protein